LFLIGGLKKWKLKQTNEKAPTPLFITALFSGTRFIASRTAYG
jgi:hypothetical protein